MYGNENIIDNTRTPPLASLHYVESLLDYSAPFVPDNRPRWADIWLSSSRNINKSVSSKRGTGAGHQVGVAILTSTRPDSCQA